MEVIHLNYEISTGPIIGGKDSAVNVGNEEIVKLLLNKDAKFNAKNVDDKTPLHIALEKGRIDIAKLLIKVSPRVFADKQGLTQIHHAVKAGNEEIINLLIAHRYGADFNAKDNQGKTPLHYAVENNYIGIIKLLINNGADLNAKDNQGKTPLDYAVKADNKEIIKLLDNGADVSAVNNDVAPPAVIENKQAEDAISGQPVEAPTIAGSDKEDGNQERPKRNKFLQMIIRNKLFISISSFVSGGAAAGVSLGLYDKIKEFLGIKKLSTWAGKILTSLGTFIGVFTILTLCRALFKKFKSSGNSKPPASSLARNQSAPAPGASADGQEEDNTPGPGKTN